MIRYEVKEFTHGPMVDHMMDNGNEISLMGRESLYLKMELSMKVNGEITFDMDLEHKLQQMAKHMKVDLRKANNTVLA